MESAGSQQLYLRSFTNPNVVIGAYGNSNGSSGGQSPTSGIVEYKKNNDGDGGNMIVVKTNSIDPNSNNIRVSFLHMAYASPLNQEDVVNTGTLIGQVGSTGDSTGPHLHMSMWNNKNGNNSWKWPNATTSIDPTDFFPQINFTGDV